MNSVLLTLAYLPNIQWFSTCIGNDIIWIEGEENFIKSTNRNRCEIAAANGRQLLSIPVAGGRDHHQKYKDTQISAGNNWQDNHWQSILSAYGSSPYFEHYSPKFAPLYQKKQELLFEFNLQLVQLVLDILKEKKAFQITRTYEPKPVDKADYRSKKNDHSLIGFPRYYQVFEERHGFMANLSIIDLIFNLGPASREYLKAIN